MQHGVTGKQYPSDCHNLLLINITSPSPQTPQGITIFHAISLSLLQRSEIGFHPLPCSANYKFIYWLVKSPLSPLRAAINIGVLAIRSESSTRPLVHLWYISQWWNIYAKPFKGFSPKAFSCHNFEYPLQVYHKCMNNHMTAARQPEPPLPLSYIWPQTTTRIPSPPKSLTCPNMP